LEVFPEIQQRYPEAMLEVVGGNPVPEVLESTEYVYVVSRLFENRQLRKQLSEKARSLMEQKYTWERAGKLYEQVLSGHQD
jgi:glycosyltransferase involved in cell wall biosynthesis